MTTAWERVIEALLAAGGAARVSSVRRASGLHDDGWESAIASATMHDPRLFEWVAPGGRRWLGLDEDGRNVLS
jgi:hypothetical protein